MEISDQELRALVRDAIARHGRASRRAAPVRRRSAAIARIAQPRAVSRSPAAATTTASA